MWSYIVKLHFRRFKKISILSMVRGSRTSISHEFLLRAPVRHLYGSLSANSNLCIIKTRFIGRIIRTRSRTTNNATLLLPYRRLLFHILFHTKSTFISPRNIQLSARQYFKSIDVGSRKNGRVLEKYSARDFA